MGPNQAVALGPNQAGVLIGAGEPVGHWGGRLIWQLADSGGLCVAWHTISWSEDARAYEKRLLAQFAARYRGVRPFANLTG